jgi:uroporphyrinogen-III synthase
MRVIVTRPQAQAEPLPIDDGPIDVTGYEWVIVTSANGAAELGARHTGVLPRVAAVGELTAAALEAHGIAVELVPTLASQEGLLAELPRPVGRALFVGAEGARRLLADELPADFRAVYRTVALTPAPPDGDLVLLASPSAAAAWAKLGSTLPAITIGPQTTAAALDAGLTVLAEADTQNVAGLVDSAAAWRASLRS